jgi:hypothetical protein
VDRDLRAAFDGADNYDVPVQHRLRVAFDDLAQSI